MGTERKSYGGYLQGTYDFGQGTSAGYSYGGNCLKRTGNDIQARGVMNCQTMHSGMIWHNVTDNFRLVAEGGFTEKLGILLMKSKKIHSVALVPSSSGRILPDTY